MKKYLVSYAYKKRMSVCYGMAIVGLERKTASRIIDLQKCIAVKGHTRKVIILAITELDEEDNDETD